MCTMEEVMMKNKKHTGTKTSKSLITIHKDSHFISKIKPKIRIIHIFAPEIIKTDVANFRELVQRLTGKPTETKKLNPRKKTHKRSGFSHLSSAKKMDIQPGFGLDPNDVMVREKIKDEEDIWVGANSGGGFLGGFADLDGFMQELNHGFSSMDNPNSYGERSLNLPTYS